MENIFSNLVDISKLTNTINILPNINSEPPPVIKKDDSSHNIINLNTLLLNEPNTHISHNNNTNTNTSNEMDITSIMAHINELNEKIIYYNTLSTLKEKENQILINDNRILRSNLDILKKRFNIK